MKTKLCLILVLTLATFGARAQGTLVIDQQAPLAMGSTAIQGTEPLGQSFTPSLSAVGYIQLALADANPGNSLGATVTVDLRAGSITGTILGTATPVTMPDGFAATVPFNNPPTFYFATPVTVTPGTMYFFDVNVLSGDTWKVAEGPGTYYANGTGFSYGVANSSFNLTFAEGVVVPEPPAAWLALAGGGMFLGLRRWRKSGG
jgi:hypothetical protein